MFDALRRRLSPRSHEPILPRLPSARGAWRRVLPREIVARIDAVPIDDRGHGFDTFGMSREGLGALMAAFWPVYKAWFRVVHHGIEHVPATGAAILAANHSGTVPFDATMIGYDVVVGAPTPRSPRPALDWFVGGMPWVGTAFVRAGAVGGSRANLHALLARGELLLVFPEGTAGVGKPFAQRYQLQRWTEGHVELAIRHGAPVVPVAVIGAEEQMPQLTRLEFLKPFGAPWLPVPATLVPFPVRYHIWYGSPIRFDHPPEASDDPVVLEAAALRVRTAVEALVERGLAERKGVFA